MTNAQAEKLIARYEKLAEQVKVPEFLVSSKDFAKANLRAGYLAQAAKIRERYSRANDEDSSCRGVHPSILAITACEDCAQFLAALQEGRS